MKVNFHNGESVEQQTVENVIVLMWNIENGIHPMEHIQIINIVVKNAGTCGGLTA